jgi:phosphoribosylformimino-5-aminoimidazole carboxamide ribotide isomerase
MPDTFEIIPAIDLIEGKCVRLSQGDFSEKTVYSDSPVDVAKDFESAGIKRLHMVDLDGAKAGQIRNLHVLEAVAAATSLEIDFSGGIKSEEDVRSVFSAGAKMVAIGSLAVREPELLGRWTMDFGSDRILVGADVRDGFVAINGWQTKTDTSLIPFIHRLSELGVERIFVTDVSKDGLLEGPATELYREILLEFPNIQLIASGGVSDISDIRALNEVGCAGAIIGKAIYEGRIKMEELASEFGG